MLTINGKCKNEFLGISISELLKSQGHPPHTVIVELNEAIPPRSSYDDIILADGDSVEILRFMGGGR